MGCVRMRVSRLVSQRTAGSIRCLHEEGTPWPTLRTAFGLQRLLRLAGHRPCWTPKVTAFAKTAGKTECERQVSCKPSYLGLPMRFLFMCLVCLLSRAFATNKKQTTWEGRSR